MIIKKKFKIVLIDSYKISKKFKKKLVNKKIFTIAIDDHLEERFANLVFSNRSDISSHVNLKYNQTWLVGPKYILIEKLENKYKKKNIPKKITNVLLHAGGSSLFENITTFVKATLEVVKKYNLKVFILCTTLRSKKFILNILDRNKISKNFYFINFNKNLSKKLSKFDIVVGPAGTTTFESIQSKTICFTVPIKNDGRDSSSTFNNIGHLMHLNNREKTNKETILKSWDYIINNFKFLYYFLNKNSKIVDGNGPKRLVSDVYNILNKNLKNSEFKIKPSQFECKRCDSSDIRPFLESRNLKQARLYSSKPNHIINWPEHLNWWFKKNIKKYKLIKSNKVVAYHWIKLNSDMRGNYVTSGWFLSNEQDNNLKNSSMVLDFQYKIVKNKFKGLTWIITMNNNNFFVERLNKKYSFKKASKISIKKVFKDNKFLENNFKVMEMKI